MMYRLPPIPGEWIDRSQPLQLEFEGGAVQGFAGDTVNAVLAANGEMRLARSFKYHRPRGIHSFANHDANQLFDIDGVPNQRGDVLPATDGARIRAVNTRGGVARDRASWVEWLAPFLPVGFYYKAFHGKNFPSWERRIRAFAGLGSVSTGAPRIPTAKRYAFCDVLVIGAGPSGMAAALAAADAGARVLLVDENARLGGSGRWSGMPDDVVADRLSRISGHERIGVLTSTFAAGYYADHWVALVEPERMSKVRARAVVFATGVIEQPAVFRNNDLPGVLTGSAVQRLLTRFAIAPGRRVCILTANREGYELARTLREHQVTVEAVLDLRASIDRDTPALSGVTCHTGVEPIEAISGARGAVQALRVLIPGGGGQKTAQTFPCDAVLMSVGFAPAGQLLLQAGTTFRYDTRLEQHTPVKLPKGVFAAGRVAGVYELHERERDGQAAGAAAAACARGEPIPESVDRPIGSRQVSHPYPVYPHPRGREFVDLDEDIQVKDLLASVQEGYDSLELMKRFSTLGMGPSQGKHSNLPGARILLRARGKTFADTALTTQRPFYHPVPLKHLAGRGFHPARRSAVHDRHAALGARWMTVGGWQRPQYYARGSQSMTDCIATEVRAVRDHAGLIDVSTLGKIEVFGPEAGAFLDRMYAGRFSDLAVGRTRYGLLLDEAGIVRDDGVVTRLGDGHFYFTTTTSGAATVYRDLLLWNARWRLDCTFVNATGHRAAFNFAGPSSRAALQPLTDVDLAEQAFPALGARQGLVAGVPARVVRAGFVSSLGFEIHVPFHAGPVVWDALMRSAPGICAFGVEAQRVLRLEKGHAIVGQDTDGLTNPLEAGLGWAVKMDKSFFVGQRSLSIHQRRGARQQLVGFVLDDERIAVAEANLVIDGSEIAGRITSLARSPTLGRTVGFALVAPHLTNVGGALHIRSSDGRQVAARVAATPFVGAT